MDFDSKYSLLLFGSSAVKKLETWAIFYVKFFPYIQLTDEKYLRAAYQENPNVRQCASKWMISEDEN